MRSAFLFIKPDDAILARLAYWVDTSQLRPVIRAEFALDDVAHWPPLEAPDRVASALLA